MKNLTTLSAAMSFIFLAQSATPALAADDPAQIAAGKTAFQSCMACHSIVPGQARLGPNLAGVVGRKAGSLSGYTYSTAMAATGYRWDAARLDSFIAAPAKTVPGTRMAFRGVDDPVRRKAIIAYLSSVSTK